MGWSPRGGRAPPRAVGRPLPASSILTQSVQAGAARTARPRGVCGRPSQVLRGREQVVVPLLVVRLRVDAHDHLLVRRKRAGTHGSLARVPRNRRAGSRHVLAVRRCTPGRDGVLRVRGIAAACPPNALAHVGHARPRRAHVRAARPRGTETRSSPPPDIADRGWRRWSYAIMRFGCERTASPIARNDERERAPHENAASVTPGGVRRRNRPARDPLRARRAEIMAHSNFCQARHPRTCSAARCLANA